MRKGPRRGSTRPRGCPRRSGRERERLSPTAQRRVRSYLESASHPPKWLWCHGAGVVSTRPHLSMHYIMLEPSAARPRGPGRRVTSVRALSALAVVRWEASAGFVVFRDCDFFAPEDGSIEAFFASFFGEGFVFVASTDPGEFCACGIAKPPAGRRELAAGGVENAARCVRVLPATSRRTVAGGPERLGSLPDCSRRLLARLISDYRGRKRI